MTDTFIKMFCDAYCDDEHPKYFVPYQKCPKCNGQGTVSKPPWLAGDIDQWSGTATSFPCDVCNGAKIIPMHILNQNELTEPKPPTP